MAALLPGVKLWQQLLEDGLRIGTTLEAVAAACDLAGVTPPQGRAPQLPSQQIMLLSVIQLGGVTLTQLDRELLKSPALPIAWQVHERALESALEPLTRLQLGLRRFARVWPIAQWSGIVVTLLIGGTLGVVEVQKALLPGALTLVGSAGLALAQYLLRVWLCRYFTHKLLGRLLAAPT